MRIPNLTELENNLRETLVVHAEVLMLAMGADLGAKSVGLITGSETHAGELPTDHFSGDKLGAIPIDHLAIYRCLRGLRDLLTSGSLGYGPNSDDIDPDFVEQEYLDLLELYLSSLPPMTLGGYDWGACRNGPLRSLLLAGQAWSRLVRVIDEGTQGHFETELLTASDLALLAGIELNSVRNLVGPKNRLRSQEQYQKRKSHVSERGFAAINRIDALDWLASRKGFHIRRLKAGILADRVRSLREPLLQGQAAMLSLLVSGHTLKSLATYFQHSEIDLRSVGDGTGPLDLANQLTLYAIEYDNGRSSDTASA